MTQERLKQLFTYRGGVLYWRISKGRVRIGQIAGTKMSNGYHMIQIGKQRYYRSNLVWYWHYGWWPYPGIDHRNQIKYDDRIENLREANAHQQQLNTKIKSNNTSGFKGVYWHSTRQKWVANIGINYKTVYLGIFDDQIDAINARRAAEQRYYDAKFYNSK
jgi:AP2 domain/HNH endonuclease